MNESIWISRSIVRHWLWEDPEKLKWWLDLLLMAAPEDKQVTHDAHIFTLKRGSLIASILSLSKRWKRDRKVVLRFLKALEEENMITRKTFFRITAVITITNYPKYQDITPSVSKSASKKKDTQRDTLTTCNGESCADVNNTNGDTQRDTLKDTLKDTLNDVKKPRRDRPNDVQEVRDYVQEKGYHFNPDEFYAFYESSNWHRGKTKITNWKQCCVTWETTWKRGRGNYEEQNKKLLEENPPSVKGSYGTVIHYIAEHSENIVKGVPLPTEAEVAEISQNYKDFFQQAVKNMDADPNLSKKTFWGAFVNAIQLTKRTIDYGTTQLTREESARIKREEQLRAFQDARDNTPDSGAFFGDY